MPGILSEGSAGGLGDRCGTTKGPQGVIVASLEGFPSLCEQRGEDDPTVSWQGCEDRSVALLVYLTRFCSPWVRPGGRRACRAGGAHP
jgi:hypothetical protein